MHNLHTEIVHSFSVCRKGLFAVQLLVALKLFFDYRHPLGTKQIVCEEITVTQDATC